MNASAHEQFADDLAKAVQEQLGKVVQFPGARPLVTARADIELHSDLHRQMVAQAEQDQAEAKRSFRQLQADIRTERKALKEALDTEIAALRARFNADSNALEERETTGRAEMDETVDKARRFAAKGRAWLAAE